MTGGHRAIRASDQSHMARRKRNQRDRVEGPRIPLSALPTERSGAHKGERRWRVLVLIAGMLVIVVAAVLALSLKPRLEPPVASVGGGAAPHRQQTRESDGEKVLRRGLALLPCAAYLHHALGLLLVRKGEKAAGLAESAAAARLAPASARYAYVYAVGLHSTGKRDAALAELRGAEARHPHDLEILGGARLDEPRGGKCKERVSLREKNHRNPA